MLLPRSPRSVSIGGWIEVDPASPVEIAYGKPSSAYTCALLDTGELWCWGATRRGQLGDGSPEDRLTPVRVKLDENVIEISAGGEHTCALSGRTTIHCWGANDHAQLGVDPTTLPFSAEPIALELP